MKNKFPRLKEYSFPKDILENREWYEKSWAGVLFSLYNIGYGCVYLLNKRVPGSFKISITFFKGDHMSWLWDTRDMIRIRKRLLGLIKADHKVIGQYRQTWKKDWHNFKQVVKRLQKIKLADLSDKGLYSEYLKLRDAYNLANSIPYLVDSFLTAGENDWLADLITKELEDKVPAAERAAVLNGLTLPVINTFSNRERIGLLKIGVAFLKTKNRLQLDRNLKKHAERYFWTEGSYYPKEALTPEYFGDKLQVLLDEGHLPARLREESGRARSNRQKKYRLIKKLKISLPLRRIIRSSEIFAAWQDDRKSNVFIANHYFFLILREVGRRVGLNPFEMYYTTDHELAEILFKRKFDRARLRRRRQNGCLVVNTPRGIALIEGKQAARYTKESFLGLDQSVTELKGVVASPGRVTGRVRVIINIEDFSKFENGEILVTNNTTPDFVPLMKKALGVITEQGGITSHAAIVSRELRKPCVIGTRAATKVLHTGDRIELDATKGTILLKKRFKG